ncbi:unnamed protein product [Vicia faba]|uniref:Uncharacterized protein n=1 Tax=Vicia faba TaxID=3906 RepID=A0AAV1AL68_VICFA|nr:unnamed protein product [Vicia faba]
MRALGPTHFESALLLCLQGNCPKNPASGPSKEVHHFGPGFEIVVTIGLLHETYGIPPSFSRTAPLTPFNTFLHLQSSNAVVPPHTTSFHPPPILYLLRIPRLRSFSDSLHHHQFNSAKS